MNSKQLIRGRRMSALGLALLVSLAFGVITASAAQGLDWQHEKKTVLASTESVEGTGKAFTISSSILGAPVEVACGTSSVSGSIAAGGGGSSTISLSGCSAPSHPKCVVNSPSLKANLELVEVASVLYQKFVSSGEGFGNLAFSGAGCAFAGIVAPLKGSFAGRELSSSLSVDHSASFTKVGKSWPAVELKLGKAVATLGGEITEHLSGSQAYHAWRSIWQETHGGWEIETGSPFTSSESVLLSGGPLKFSFVRAGSTVAFSCTETTTGGSTLVPGGTETVKGLTFSGCKVETPASCTVNYGNSFTLNSITGTLVRVNGKTYEKFTPTYPEGGFGVLYFQGSSCPMAGTGYEMKGSFAGLGPEFGVSKVTQPLEFSDAANEATGSQWILGTGWPLHVTGSLNRSLVKATPWGAF